MRIPIQSPKHKNAAPEGAAFARRYVGFLYTASCPSRRRHHATAPRPTSEVPRIMSEVGSGTGTDPAEITKNCSRPSVASTTLTVNSITSVAVIPDKSKPFRISSEKPFPFCRKESCVGVAGEYEARSVDVVRSNIVNDARESVGGVAPAATLTSIPTEKVLPPATVVSWDAV